MAIRKGRVSMTQHRERRDLLVNTLFRYFTTSYRHLPEKMEKYLVVSTVGAFVAGVFVASKWLAIPHLVDSIVSAGLDLYGYIVPLVIFVVLAPSLGKMVNSRTGQGGRFAGYAIFWLSTRRLMSLVWAAVFTVLAFGFPFFPTRVTDVRGSLLHALTSLGWMAVHSSYFYAMYASIVTVILSRKIPKMAAVLERCAKGVETIGQYFVPVVPVFMFAIGSYVYSLPQSITGQINTEHIVSLHPMHVFGYDIASSTSVGIVVNYILLSLLIGLACAIWHVAFLVWTRRVVRGFSIKKYISNYWVKVYPLLWATSSEALATPLNLFLVKKHYPHIKPEVRRFIVGVGSYLSINGTMICVLVVAGAVASMLGMKLSLVELLLCIPVVFLIGFGVPGIPGELLLFAGPMAMLLRIPDPLSQGFLALYLALQVGLPDSFRTGNNSTDDCLSSILMNKRYRESFQDHSQIAVGGIEAKHQNFAPPPIMPHSRPASRLHGCLMDNLSSA